MDGPQLFDANRPSIAERLGLFGPGDPDLVNRVVVVLLAVYVVSFAIFYPEIATNDDEAMYLRQARLALHGPPTATQIDPMTGQAHTFFMSTYAPGTAMVMAPLVELFGWRGAFVIPCLSLLAAVWLTLLWIREAGHSSFFALVVLGFPPALVLGRVAMSDVPSAAVAALGFYLFWRGQERHAGWWVGAGLVAGASWVFRVTNPILFIPLFVGTVLRREWKCWALILGGILGIGLRFLCMYIYFGEGLYERSAYHPAFSSIMERLPLYLIGLMVFVPGGLVFSALYKGARRPEIIATVGLVFFFFLLQQFSTKATSFEKRLVLALRYFIPMLPIVAFAMSQAVPRVLRSLLERGGTARRFGLGLGTAGVVWAASLGVAAAAVHPLFSVWSSTQAELRDVIARLLPHDAVYVTNWMGTRKFIPIIGQKYIRIDRDRVTARDIQLLLEAHDEVYIVLASRNDSAHWLRDEERSEAFLASLRTEPELLEDHAAGSIDRIRLFRLDADSPPRSKRN